MRENMDTPGFHCWAAQDSERILKGWKAMLVVGEVSSACHEAPDSKQGELG